MTLAAIQGPRVPDFESVPSYLLIGLDFLVTHGATVDFPTKTLTFRSKIPRMIRNQWDLLAIDLEPSGQGFVVTQLFPSHPWASHGLLVGDRVIAQNGHWNAFFTKGARPDLQFLQALADAQTLQVRRGEGFLELRKEPFASQ